MKKKAFVALLLCMMLLLTSCVARYRFLNAESEIAEISIVHVSMEEDEVIQEELVKIQDLSGFLADFKKVTCRKRIGDPSALYPNDEGADAIKILYSDGSYELINYFGRATFQHDRGFNFYAGIRAFDEAEYRSFIEKYLSES